MEGRQPASRKGSANGHAYTVTANDRFGEMGRGRCASVCAEVRGAVCGPVRGGSIESVKRPYEELRGSLRVSAYPVRCGWVVAIATPTAAQHQKPEPEKRHD